MKLAKKKNPYFFRPSRATLSTRWAIKGELGIFAPGSEINNYNRYLRLII